MLEENWLLEFSLQTLCLVANWTYFGVSPAAAMRKGGTAATITLLYYTVSRLPETGVVKSGGVADMTKAEQSLDRTGWPRSYMPQSTSGNCLITFSHLVDCATFRVLSFLFVSKTKESHAVNLAMLGKPPLLTHRPRSQQFNLSNDSSPQFMTIQPSQEQCMSCSSKHPPPIIFSPVLTPYITLQLLAC